MEPPPSILATGHHQEHLIHGLTVSERILTTAAVGIAIGLGQTGIALITAVLTILVSAVLAALDR